MTRSLLVGFTVLWLGTALLAADGNRLTYLDEFCDPYYPHRNFPKLTTPQWVGEEGVECVVVLAIDDMRDPEKYETYLRPILDRLKQIDGRAPVSIMTCQADPKGDRLQQWLQEGLSLEVHTFDHPCPCLAGGDFAKAKGTYDKCVDLMHSIPGNKPVAFRMPCCDSLNTPSPRFWMEVFNKTTEQGHYLSIDTSVFNIITGKDTALPESIRLNEQGEERFRRYVPFKSFVNTIEDYPYPYVIGKLCWQFPCVVPSDWSAQHVQKPNNPDTVRDLKLALDACVIKQGVYNLVFHPHGWIRNDQVVELIDHAVAKHGKKVKFLNFRECDERLTKNLLAGTPLRDPKEFKQDPLGGDNGVRILDVNNDGYMDVVVGERVRRWTADAPIEKREGTTRIWDPTNRRWVEGAFPEQMDASGPRFGTLREAGAASMVGRRGDIYHFHENTWKKHEPQRLTPPIRTNPDKGNSAIDHGVQLRDFDHDNVSECLDRHGRVYRLDSTSGDWVFATPLPSDLRLASWHEEKGQKTIDDRGLRFVDLDGDNDDDIVVANEKQQGVWLFDSLKTGWKPVKLPEGFTIPLIAREGTNNGAWFHSGQLWVQNEDTNRLPDHVDRRSFAQLLGEEKQEAEAKPGQVNNVPPVTPTDRKSAAGQEATEERIKDLGAAKSPEEGLKSIAVKKGFKVELVATEPLIVDPVAFDWGPDGRLWVVEMRDYPRGIDEQGKPGGRVKVLTDKDGDGRYDEAQTFLDDLPYPTGIKVWRKGVLITAAPEVIYAEDADNDGRADVKKTLYRGFGEGNQQHRVNGLRWGMDGWLYLGNGDSGGKIESLITKAQTDIGGRDLRIRPDTGELDAVSGATQFSLCFDDFGNRFGGNNSNPLWHYVVEDYHLRQNPKVKPPATRHDVPTVPGNAPIFPLSKTVTRFNDYHTANRFTSACGIEIYRDDYLGKEYYGNSFVCEPVHNLIHREIVEPDGLSFKSRRAKDEQESEFLASTDNWFRPVMARTGPDGALYIADMYRMVVEHPTWIPEDWQKQLNLRAGDDKGRIYRVVRDDVAPRKLAPLDKLATRELVEELRSPSGTRRDLVQQMLMWKGDAAAGDLLRKLVRNEEAPALRVQALWTLAGVPGLKESDIIGLLNNHAPVGVICAAVQLARIHFADKENVLIRFRQVSGSKLGDDQRVALQTVLALASWDNEYAGLVLASIAKKHRDVNLIQAMTAVSLNNGKKVFGFVDSLSDDEEMLQSFSLPFHVSDEQWKTLADDKNWKSTSERMLRAVEYLDTVRATIFPPRIRTITQSALVDLTTQAKKLVADEKTIIADRVTACRLLLLQEVWLDAAAGQKPDYGFVSAIFQLHLPNELRGVVKQELGRTHSFPYEDLLYERWLDRTPAQRLLIFDLLVANERATPALEKMLERKLLAPADLDATRIQLLRHHPNAIVRRKSEELMKAVNLSDRAEVVTRFADVLELRGDLARGRAAFRKRCTACHRQESEGRQIGPDLASLTDKSSKALLTAILDPNRAVEAKFVENLAITDGGKLISGIVVTETGTSVTLLGADGKEQTLLRSEIEELLSNKKSLMPEGLERDLSKQEIADVIAYLQATVRPPKAFTGNTPQLVKADRAGVLELAASAARLYGPSLVFESKYKNLGYWQHETDVAEWSLEVPADGKYTVELDIACDASAAGNTLQISVGDQTLLLKIPSTGTWDDYKPQVVGIIELRAGPAEAILRSSGAVRGALIDLRSVKLTPVK